MAIIQRGEDIRARNEEFLASLSPDPDPLYIHKFDETTFGEFMACQPKKRTRKENTTLNHGSK
jgi:hypothetical protein